MAVNGKKSGLSVTQVCTIIRECTKHKVSTLKFGDLELSFSVNDPRIYNKESDKKLAKSKSETQPVKAITEEQHTKLNKEAIEKEELELRQEQMSTMFIEDPFMAEQLLKDGELEDDDGDDAKVDE